MTGLELAEPVFGGDNRADSVMSGLNAYENVEHVLIHDGARPYIGEALSDRICNALSIHQAVIPALPVTDALWRVEGDHLEAPVSRENLVAAQTPQGFHFHAYKSICQGGDALDDAQLALQNGLDVAWVEGEKDNIKLTYPEDFQS